MKLSETANEVGSLAEKIRTYWDTELPKRHRDYPLVRPGEDSGPPPPEEEELRELLERLPEDEIYKLLLIMHLGEGGFGTDDLAGHYEALKERYESRDWAIIRLMGTGHLAEYLTDGSEELKKHGIDVDNLGFVSVDSR